MKKVALVTGAGRGIGAAAAKALAAQGWAVVLFARSKNELDETVAEIKKIGGEARAHVGDVSLEADVLRAFDEAEKNFGGVNVVVNNAAAFVGGHIEGFSAQDWDRIFAVNVRGVFLCSREAFRRMKSGSIINISSLGGIRGTEKFPGFSAYTASKHAVIGMTEALAVEGRVKGIRVNAIAPGAVNTRMLREAAPHLKSNTSAGDIAKLITFLADDVQSGSLNGAVLEVHSNL